MKLSKVFGFIFSLFLVLLFYSTFIHQAFALTFLEDAEISSDTTWTKAEGPYVISGDLFVLGGATLTIEPGVSVKLFERSYIDVTYGGLLKTVGTKEEPVVFSSVYDEYGEDILNDCNQVITSENTGSGEGQCSNDRIFEDSYYFGWSGWGWGGPWIYGGGIDLKYTNIYHLKEGGYVYDTDFAHIDNLKFDNNGADLAFKNANVTVTNSEFANITTNPLYVMGTGEVNLQNVKFIDNREGITVFRGGTLNGDNVIIDGVSDGRAIDVFNGGSVTFSSTTIKNINDDDAIEVFEDGHLVLKNSMIENVSGLWSRAVAVFTWFNQPLSTVELSEVTLLSGDDAGFLASGNVEVKISKSKINNFLGAGIDITDGAKVFVDGTEISNNSVGIEGDYYYTVPTASQLEIKNSSISNNSLAGISSWKGALPAKAVNNYWGDASGPYNENLNIEGLGDSVSDNVEFNPWLLEPPIQETSTCCSNVIFIPGLQSSRLYTRGLLSENQLWEPNRNADIEWLYLDENGESLYDVYTRDIIKRSNIGMGVLDVNIYKSFADGMDSLVGEKKINELKALPYDWRMDLNKIVTEPIKLENGQTYNFIDEIIRLADGSKTKKVSIVTHSNGGLIAKTLIMELQKRGKENLIDNLVMVAAPELGTPLSIASLLHGDEQELAGGFLVNKSTARTLGENMMGAYNLLPSDEYFKKVASPVIEFDPSISGVNNFRDIYGENIDNVEELKNFLLGFDGRAEPENSSTDSPNVLKTKMVSLAQENHKSIDTFVMPENIKVTELAGWGISTVRGIKYVGVEYCLPNVDVCSPVKFLDRQPLFTTEGDETVVAPSATLSPSIYYLDLRNLKNVHKDILEASSSVVFMKNILLNSTSSLPEYVSKDKPVSVDKTLELALHSPVSIDVYDDSARHTGIIDNPNPNSDFRAFEENILRSRYIEFGEGKYVLLDEGGDYTVKLQGLDFGTFSLEANELSSSGETLATSSFVDIPTNENMKGEILISKGSTSTKDIQINIDVNGDGENDFTVGVGEEFDPIIYLQILKKTVETLNASEKTKVEILRKIEKVIKSLEQDKIKNAIVNIRQFSKYFANKDKYERMQNKNKQIEKGDLEKTLQMLDQLLNNLIK